MKKWIGHKENTKEPMPFTNSQSKGLSDKIIEIGMCVCVCVCLHNSCIYPHPQLNIHVPIETSIEDTTGCYCLIWFKSARFLTDRDKMLCGWSWLCNSEHWLHLQRTWVRFPSPIHQLTLICDSSPSNTFSGFWGHCAHMAHMYM